jgi:hypothetical protein
MRHPRTFLIGLTLIVSACGGGGGGGETTYAVGRAVSGLAGSGLILSDSRPGSSPSILVGILR